MKLDVLQGQQTACGTKIDIYGKINFKLISLPCQFV